MILWPANKRKDGKMLGLNSTNGSGEGGRQAVAQAAALLDTWRRTIRSYVFWQFSDSVPEQVNLICLKAISNARGHGPSQSLRHKADLPALFIRINPIQ